MLRVSAGGSVGKGTVVAVGVTVGVNVLAGIKVLVAEAMAEVAGPGAALALVDGLGLNSYHLFHAVRADLLRRLGRSAEATEVYQAAISRTENTVEREFLARSLQSGQHA